jgi:hypothetical protein
VLARTSVGEAGAGGGNGQGLRPILLQYTAGFRINNCPGQAGFSCQNSGEFPDGERKRLSSLGEKFCLRNGKFRILIDSGDVGATAEAPLSVAFSTIFKKGPLACSVRTSVRPLLQTVMRRFDRTPSGEAVGYEEMCGLREV